MAEACAVRIPLFQELLQDLHVALVHLCTRSKKGALFGLKGLGGEPEP